MQKVQENCYSLPKKELTWLTNMNSAYHEPSWRHKANCNALCLDSNTNQIREHSGVVGGTSWYNHRKLW